MWISKKRYRELFNISIEADNLKIKIRSLEYALERAGSASGTFKETSLARLDEIKALKARLEEKEEIFIGKTVKKLLKNIGRTEIINRPFPVSNIPYPFNSLINRGLF